VSKLNKIAFNEQLRAQPIKRGNSMATVNLTTVAELEETLAKNDIVLIDFWAQWCGPCKMFGPIFEKVSDQHPEIVFAKVDTEEARELAGAFQVSSIPTLAIFRENIMVFKQPGMVPEEGLKDLIEQVSKLNMDKVRADIEEQKNA
jgi:thioredoxin 1